MKDVFDIFGLTEGGDIIYYLLQEKEVEYAHADYSKFTICFATNIDNQPTRIEDKMPADKKKLLNSP